MKKKERERGKGKSAQEIIIIIIETIEVEATSAVLVATKERERMHFYNLVPVVCATRMIICLVIEAWLDDDDNQIYIHIYIFKKNRKWIFIRFF